MWVVFLQILILEMFLRWSLMSYHDKIYNSQILLGVKNDYNDYFLKTERWKIIHF